jgi:hypothetical protein
MKKILPLLAVATLVLTACSKDDNLGTKPEIVFKSYSVPYIVKGMDNFDVTFQIKDGDGDIQSLFYFQTLIDSKPDLQDDSTFQPRRMPNIETHHGTKIDAELIYNMYGPDFVFYDEIAQPDSLRLKVFIVDEAGHSSDTILTPKIAIIKQ